MAVPKVPGTTPYGNCPTLGAFTGWYRGTVKHAVYQVSDAAHRIELLLMFIYPPQGRFTTNSLESSPEST